jgi:hypothetical protein
MTLDMVIKPSSGRIFMPSIDNIKILLIRFIKILNIQRPFLEIFPILSPFMSKIELERLERYNSESFITAARDGDAETIKLFLESDMDNHIHESGSDTPLIAAVREGHKEIVCLILFTETAQSGKLLILIGIITILTIWSFIFCSRMLYKTEEIDNTRNGDCHYLY